MSHNVPGCKRRFASPNKQTVRFAGLANCGGVRRGNGAKRNDLAERSPSRRKAAKRLQSCYTMIFLPPLTTAVVHGRTTAWNKFFIYIIYNIILYPIFTNKYFIPFLQ